MMDRLPRLSPTRASVPTTADAVPRLFFALVPDADVRAQLAPVAREWALRAHGRPTAAESVHLTLAFIGVVPRERVDVLVAIGAAMPRGRFDVALDTVGDFRHTRVAWIAPSAPPPALFALQAALAADLAARGFAVESRPFRAHLTLARKCGAALVTTTIPAIRWRIDRLALIASTLDRAGARYRELASWPLYVPAAT
jgi:RNA 2',3'-cyclic 3'-phosphodiesterase